MVSIVNSGWHDHQYTIGQSGIQLANTKIYIQKITKQQIGAFQVNIETWTEVDEFKKKTIIVSLLIRESYNHFLGKMIFALNAKV